MMRPPLLIKYRYCLRSVEKFVLKRIKPITQSNFNGLKFARFEILQNLSRLIFKFAGMTDYFSRQHPISFRAFFSFHTCCHWFDIGVLISELVIKKPALRNCGKLV